MNCYVPSESYRIYRCDCYCLSDHSHLLCRPEPTFSKILRCMHLYFLVSTIRQEVLCSHQLVLMGLYCCLSVFRFDHPIRCRRNLDLYRSSHHPHHSNSTRKTKFYSMQIDHDWIRQFITYISIILTSVYDRFICPRKIFTQNRHHFYHVFHRGPIDWCRIPATRHQIFNWFGTAFN